MQEALSWNTKGWRRFLDFSHFIGAYGLGKDQYCQFIAVPIKNLIRSFVEMDKQILKFIWKYKEPKINKTFMSNSKSEDLALQDFKTYYKAIATKRLLYWPMSKTNK